MSKDIASTFATEDDGLFVQYKVDFQGKAKLLGSGPMTSSTARDAGGSFAGVTETLVDDIKWEPRVDEADKLDYIVAVSSGVLAGLVDSFFVGEFSLDRAEQWGKDTIAKVVMKVARVEGYAGEDLKDAVKLLEKNHPFAADGNTQEFGGGLQHHLRDFSHHFSIGGLFFSIFTQFTGLVVGTDDTGHLMAVPVSKGDYIGRNFQEKVSFGAIDWFFHMVSDMAGSSGARGDGVGIPGPLVSFMKELSALPFFKETNSDAGMGFRLWVSKLFNGTLLADRDENGKILKGGQKRFDLRAEIGILEEIGRQSIPVLINQCLVRAFYFCRRLAREIKELGIRGIADLRRIAPEDVLPLGTPAMRRMVTVSSGVFVGVDIAGAAVRAARAQNAGVFFLHVNYVGVATFVIACVVDVSTAREGEKIGDGETPEEAYERGLFELDCLKLDFKQARILHSIEHALVAYDIAIEKHPKRAEKKRAWLKEWSEGVVDAINCVWAADAGYFMDDKALYTSIKSQLSNEMGDSWLWLVAMEAAEFKPYVPLYGGNDKQYKGLKLDSDYLGEVFCTHQEAIGKTELEKLGKSVSKTRAVLDGSVKKTVVGGVAAVAAAAATAGAAFYLAPAIAPTLAGVLGFNAAALHGAALTSASLAFLGGGALAVGGAGMAGGTTLIVGGGALLGAIGGSGASAATSMALATNGSYVLNECAKLVTFCEDVLIKRCGDFASVARIHTILNQRIIELEVRIEDIKQGSSNDNDHAAEDDGTDNEDKISPKKARKILSRSCTFMQRSSDKLVAVLRGTDDKRAVLAKRAK